MPQAPERPSQPAERHERQRPHSRLRGPVAERREDGRDGDVQRVGVSAKGASKPGMWPEAISSPQMSDDVTSVASSGNGCGAHSQASNASATTPATSSGQRSGAGGESPGGAPGVLGRTVLAVAHGSRTISSTVTTPSAASVRPRRWNPADS